MNQENIGEIIKKIRKDNNLTQAEFANKYGVSYQAVSKWENGKNIPDIELLKKICDDNNISVDGLLSGKKIDNGDHLFNVKTIVMFCSILLILAILFLVFKNDSSFEFKTITSSCDEFKISGSISYSNSKTSIYISNVNYCSGDDQTLYYDIECSLYEDDGINENRISTYTYDKHDGIKLEDFFTDVVFAVDDYKRTCSIYSNESLFLKINAKDNDGGIVSYKIPLTLTDTCNK